MTLFGAPLSLLGPAFAAGGAALVGLYLLRLRRLRVEVPFAELWRKVLTETQTTALWRRLRRVVSLLVQLVLLALLAGAIADPRLGVAESGRTVVLLVDTSASMQATDGQLAGRRHGTRLAQAQDAAQAVLRALGPEDTAMLLTLDGRPALVTGLQAAGDGEPELARQVAALAATDTPADLERALRLAGDALRGRPRPTLVLVGDGAYDEDILRRIVAGSIDLKGVDLRFHPVGASGDNLGITAFAVRRYRANNTSYEVFIEVQSYFARPAAAKLELLQDGEVVEVESLRLQPGERLQRRYPNLAGAGTRLEARLSPDSGAAPLDALPLDDHAYALLAPRKKVKLLLVTAGNLFLEGALLLDDNLSVAKIAPAAYDAAATAGYDAVVLDGFTPPRGAAPRTHALYLDPQGDGSPFAVHGTIDAPMVTELADKHPLMRWVQLKDLNIARASRLQLEPGDVAVAASLRAPIIAARERAGVKTVAFGFDLRRSDLPLRVAFPVLLVNALDWFAGADTGLVASYPTGRALRLPVPPELEEVAIRGPPGVAATRAPVRDGRAAFYAARAGYYELDADGGSGAIAPAKWVTRAFAANLASPSESRIQPRVQLIVDGHRLDAGAFTAGPSLRLRRALWPYLLLLALLVAFIEWLTYNRRVTV